MRAREGKSAQFWAVRGKGGTTTHNNTHTTTQNAKHTNTHTHTDVFFFPEFGFSICPNVISLSRLLQWWAVLKGRRRRGRADPGWQPEGDFRGNAPETEAPQPQQDLDRWAVRAEGYGGVVSRATGTGRGQPRTREPSDSGCTPRSTEETA